MISEIKKGKENWILINQESPENTKDILTKYNLDHRIIKEIDLPTPQSKIEFYTDEIYIILHFPAFRASSLNKRQEVDFIISKTDTITIQYENIDAIDKISKHLELDEMLTNKHINDFSIFTLIVKNLYQSINDELLYIESWSEKISKNIFGNKQKEMVFEISKAMKELLMFEKITEPHERILGFLKDGSKKIINENFSIEVEALIVEIQRLRKLIRNEMDILKELRNTNQSMLTSKQEDIMKTLTVITFIYLPINLIVDIFTMEAKGTPILENQKAFYIIMAMCILTLLAMIKIAKNKNWI